MRGEKGTVIAKEEALQLVAYLQALKQTKLPSDAPKPVFLFEKPGDVTKDAKAVGPKELNGAILYTNNCQSCHQQNGEGLKGAFPPLKGSSKVVLDENPELLVNIIMNGYSGREKEGFGVMPAVGTNNRLKPEEIAAIMNHERSSWGNNAKKVTVDEVKKLMDKVKVTAK
ncbi:c-type cytochrome [Pedobacter sp. NJ-S-72]